MEDVLKVKIQPLNAGAFKPYGQVLQEKQLIYPQTEEGRVAMEILHLKYRPNAKRMDQLAIHFSYNQTFIPTQGSMVLVVAPAPRNREAGPAGYEVNYEKVAAFAMEPGQVTFIDKGVWHNLITLNNSCTFINVTRKNTGEGISPAEELEGKIEKAHAIRSYVEYVDLRKRDNRVIELEL